jgi:DNA repair exonuclease SbcCD ATPase subunit
MNVEYKPPTEPLKLDTIDWKSVHDLIAKMQKATLEDLKKNDPKLEEIQAEYDNAGGDPALLEKRVSRWKQDVADALQSDKERGDEYAAREEKLRKNLAEAEARLQESETNYNGFSRVLEQKRDRLETLAKKRAALKPDEDLSSQEEAELCLLENEVVRLEKDVDNYYKQNVSDKFARASAASMLEKERLRHEQLVDDDRVHLTQPTPDDIHKMPLKAKYTELTGKSVPE